MPAFPAIRRMRSAGTAFTLVELLVSITIIAAIATLTTQMIGGAVRVTNSSRQRLDADAQARLVFNRLSADIGQALANPNVDCLFAKRDGGADAGGTNDTFYFCSEAAAFHDGAPSPAARSTVALVGYRINSRFQLERLGKGLTWDGNVSASAAGGPVHLTYLPGQATADRSTTLDGRWPASVDAPGSGYSETGEPDAHLLAEGVFRLEVCFLLTDGGFSTRQVTAPAGQKNNLAAAGPPTPADDGGTNGGYTVGSRWYDNTAKRGYVCKLAAPGAAVWESAGLRDVRGIVVSLGLLDAASRKTAPTMTDPTNAAQRVADLGKLQALLGDAAEADVRPVPAPTAANPPKLPAAAWVREINSDTFAARAGLPRPAAGQVRVYQRIILLSSK